jgi:hypothetical protein
VSTMWRSGAPPALFNRHRASPSFSGDLDPPWATFGANRAPTYVERRFKVPPSVDPVNHGFLYLVFTA